MNRRLTKIDRKCLTTCVNEEKSLMHDRTSFSNLFFPSLYRRYQSVMKRRVEDRQQHSNIEKLFNQVDERLIKYIYNKKKGFINHKNI